MIMRALTATLGRRFRAGFALMSLVFLASCQTEPAVHPTKQVVADSTQVNDDPPVKPSGPGGGK